MKIIEFSVQEPYRSYIMSGVKTVEGRLNKGKFATLESGDRLCLDNQAFFEVIETVQYPTFRAMIESEGVECIVPDKPNIDDAVQVYYRFYTPEQEKEFGVLAIKIKRLE